MLRPFSGLSWGLKGELPCSIEDVPFPFGGVLADEAGGGNNDWDINEFGRSAEFIFGRGAAIR